MKNPCVFLYILEVIWNVFLLLAVLSPQKTKGPEDSEPHEQKLGSATETSTVQQLVSSLETEEPVETSAALTENISQNEDHSKPCLEEQKTNLSPTKEPTPACSSHEEEPMEVSFTEEPSTEAHGAPVEPEVSAAKTTPGGQSQEETDVMVQQHDIIPESRTQEMDITMDDDERCLAKLSSLVEERTSLQQPPFRQPEVLPSVGHGASQLQTQAVSGQAISNVPSSTFIPFPPKIGMGKPAISKRKFSPGRPRVKQVSHIFYDQLCVGLCNLLSVDSCIVLGYLISIRLCSLWQIWRICLSSIPQNKPVTMLTLFLVIFIS